MNGSRDESLSSGSAGRKADDRPALGVPGAEPHGYDPVEFGPGESRRDFPARRGRGADEERRLLKEAQAAFEGPDRRHDLDDGPDVDAAGPDHDAQERRERPSRLYRD